MANLGSNPLWKQIEENPTNITNDILGPSYSYSGNVPGPTSLGVGSSGSISQLTTNFNAAIDYVKVLITGDPPLGNQYYINTGGVCVAPDGSTQPRSNYINNMSTGSDLVPSSLNELSFITSDLNGLLPGAVGDIEGLDPLYLFNSLTTSGTPSCECYKCPVTSGSQFAFLTTSLSPDYDPNLCSQVDPSNCTNPAPSSTESFENRGSSTALPTILAVGALVLLTFSGK
jgi:hypothetical protein